MVRGEAGGDAALIERRSWGTMALLKAELEAETEMKFCAEQIESNEKSTANWEKLRLSWGEQLREIQEDIERLGGRDLA